MTAAPAVPAAQPDASLPWQLRLFRKTLKKRQKFDLLRRLLVSVGPEERLLLLTNGDNNGALNWSFRSLGGRWSWGELEAGQIPEMQAFLGEPVVACTPDRLDFSTGAFDTVVVIDVHEHLADTTALNRELFRVVRPGGRAIVTTPNGDSRKLAVRIKNALGMTREVYGHVRDGYTIPELRQMLSATGFRPLEQGSYANFFTEMVELAINLAYVKVLNRRKAGRGEGHASIAPSSAEQARKADKALRLYGVLYPFCRAVASLDGLLDPFSTGYAVAVACERPNA